MIAEADLRFSAQHSTTQYTAIIVKLTRRSVAAAALGYVCSRGCSYPYPSVEPEQLPQMYLLVVVLFSDFNNGISTTGKAGWRRNRWGNRGGVGRSVQLLMGRQWQLDNCGNGR